MLQTEESDKNIYSSQW